VTPIDRFIPIVREQADKNLTARSLEFSARFSRLNRADLENSFSPHGRAAVAANSLNDSCQACADFGFPAETSGDAVILSA
jgi:hypothetical protein